MTDHIKVLVRESITRHLEKSSQVSRTSKSVLSNRNILGKTVGLQISFSRMKPQPRLMTEEPVLIQ